MTLGNGGLVGVKVPIEEVVARLCEVPHNAWHCNT